MPTFSVIMPAFNQQTHVAAAIRSVLEQTCRDWELLVIDDGSTDATPEIVDRLAREDRRVVVVHQKNAGAPAARNRALELARGTWIAYLDSDDVWFQDALENYAGYIAAHPEAQFIHGYYHRLRGDTVIPLNGEHQDRLTGTAELFWRIFLAPQCVCHRRDLLQRSGVYDASLRYCEDYELFLRMSLFCRFEPIGKLIGLRRRHDGNHSKQTGKSQQVEADMLRRFVEEQGGRELLDPADVAHRLGTVYYRAARQFFKERHYRQASAMARLARSYRPTFKAGLVGVMSFALGVFEKAA